MGSDNSTTYSIGSGKHISYGTCMSIARNGDEDLHVYIPFTDLNKGISREDAEEWFKIGESLIFPAKVSEVFNNYNTIRNNENTNEQLAGFVNIKVRCKTNYKYHAYDANNIKLGIIKNFYGPFDMYQRMTVKIEIDRNGFRQSVWDWSCVVSDLELVETGECLYEYIKKFMPIEEPKEHINSYKITINRKKAFSDYHKLAILTFYRFLYSDIYDGIVQKSLKLIRFGIDPWDAMYYVLSTKQYEPYYSFLTNPGFVPMGKVVSALKVNSTINNSFSFGNRKLQRPVMNVADIKGAVEQFKLNEMIDGNAQSFGVVCVTDKLSSLTSGKTYRAVNCFDNNKYIVFNTDDWKSRRMLKKHFSKV